MTRVVGPESNSRFVYRSLGTAIVSAAGASAVVYAAETGSTLASILTEAGAAIPGSALTVNAYSQLPLFQFPDGVSTVFVEVAGGPRTAVYNSAVFGAGTPATRQLYGPFPFSYLTPDLFQPALGAVLFSLPAGAIIETAWIEESTDGPGWDAPTAVGGMDVVVDNGAEGTAIVQYDFSAHPLTGHVLNSRQEIAPADTRRQYFRVTSASDVWVSAWGDGSTPSGGASNLYILVTVPA